MGKYHPALDKEAMHLQSPLFKHPVMDGCPEKWCLQESWEAAHSGAFCDLCLWRVYGGHPGNSEREGRESQGVGTVIRVRLDKEQAG